MGYPFVQAAQHGGEGNLPPTRVVIHATVSQCIPGGARAIASYFSNVTRPASAHYVVDPREIVQCLRESTIGYHAPPNTHSIGIELCDMQAGAGTRWADDYHEAMLVLAAGLVREVAARYGIPLVKLSSADLLAGKRGICGHIDVTNAWHQTTHTDPGPDFPWAHFMALVQGDDDVTPEDRAAIVADVVAALKANIPAWVWLTKTTIGGDPDGKAIISVLGRDVVRQVPSLASRVGALEGTVTGLQESVPAAVSKALADGTVTVDVNVTGGKQ